jgi:tetratricopeptide (TPR) repeat protein
MVSTASWLGFGWSLLIAVLTITGSLVPGRIRAQSNTKLAIQTQGPEKPEMLVKGEQFGDPALRWLEKCVENNDGSCAQAALRQIHDRGIEPNGDYLDLKARALLLLHQKHDALEAIERALQLNPQKYRYRMTEGRIYQSIGDEKSAIRSFLLADRLQPHSAETFYSLGMSFFILGAYERSAKHFQEALGLDPSYHRATFMLGIIYMIQFRLADAKVQLQKAVAAVPKNPFFHLYYGILLKRLGDDSDALREVVTAKSLDPSYAITRFNLGLLLSEKGKYKAAKLELEEAVRLRPRFSAAYYQLGLVYHRLGMEAESQKAHEEFEKAKAEEDRSSNDPLESAVSGSEPQPTSQP